MKKLAILLPGYFEEHIGGAEYQSYLLAQAAKEQGYAVHYVFASSRDDLANPLQIHLRPMPRMNIKRRFGAAWGLYSWRIRRVLDSIGPDALYVRGGLSWAGIAARYAERAGCRSIWHVASSADVTALPLMHLLRRPLDLVERKAIGYAIRHSTHVVTQARYQSDLLVKHYGRESTVIMNATAAPEGPFEKGRPFTVVWIANIKPLKQPEMFIRLARALQDCPNVRFLMIGRPAGGKYQQDLHAQLGGLKNLEYIGEQPIDEVDAVLARSHLLVNTSLYEGFSNTFIQAWMREVPVLSMLVDPDDILTRHKIGLFSGSFEQLVKDVRKLVENPTLCDEMGRRAREYALENHSLKKNMGRLLELIFNENSARGQSAQENIVGAAGI